MALGTKVSGTWHTVQYAHVNVSSTWRHVPQVYVNVSGTWRPLFSFVWEQGAWSGCSATCGGGTQTRTVRCKRNDGTYWADSVCSNFVGTKPSTSQACNTQACATCYYSNTEAPYYYWFLGANRTGVIIFDHTTYYMEYTCLIEDANINTTSVSCNGKTYYRGTMMWDQGVDTGCNYKLCF